MSRAEDFYSVGIDIGTTTTQVIFSRLVLEKTGGFSSIQQVKIAEKKVVYKSDIHFTPLVRHDIIDAVKLRDIVALEFSRSGLKQEDITTGAVIITGESARKENAREVSRRLADFAGDFVVCTAGPDYESVLAGWGSGAGEASKNTAGNIVNFDIGGGTTNAAVFCNGEVADAYAADIGGRLVKIGPDTTITYVSGRIEKLLDTLGLTGIKTGRKADPDELGRLAQRMAEMFLELAGEREISEETRDLLIQHPPAPMKIDRVMFSGGVAECIYDQILGTPESGFLRYGDIGPLLGSKIRALLPLMRAEVLHPHEKIRATVVGAGSYSVELSGSTVDVDANLLPIKNVPIVKVSYDPAPEPLGDRLARQIKIYGGEQVAVAISGLANPGYSDIKKLAAEIHAGLAQTANMIIVIVEYDCAKAIGLLLRSETGGKRQLICLDKIRVSNGDYIDIGKPISGVVPVIVKTLIFGS